MFGGVTDDELNLIRPSLDQKRFTKGTCVLKQGEPNSNVYFIAEGMVRIQKVNAQQGKPDREITVLKPGDAFGEMELIDIQPCAASVVCLTDTVLVTLSNRDLYLLSKTHLMTFTMIIMNLAREISRRLRSTDELLALVSEDHPEKPSVLVL